MTDIKKKNFSLYFWLLKKLDKELVIWYFLTFSSSFFYYQATNGIKLWGRKETVFPLPKLFGSFTIDSRARLIWYSFFCFFIGNLLISLISEYLRSYILELCRTNLRRLIVRSSAENPQQTQKCRKEILHNFLGETELFVPLFILVPQRIFAAVINIIFTIVFLGSFPSKNLTNPFILFASLTIAILSFLFYKIQAKINHRQNQFRCQENIAMENYLESQDNPEKVERLINLNFHKNKAYLWKKTISYLPTLVISGLGILFCFVYSGSYGNNWEIKEFIDIGLIAGSIQTIFWKVKEITDNLPEISKIKIHSQSLKKVVNNK